MVLICYSQVLPTLTHFYSYNTSHAPYECFHFTKVDTEVQKKTFSWDHAVSTSGRQVDQLSRLPDYVVSLGGGLGSLIWH